MKLKIFICVLFATLLISFKASATNLRGRLVRFVPAYNSYIVLQRVRIDLWVFNGQQWVDIAYSFTGDDGMYYFNNLAPGTNFKVQVFGNFFPAQPLVVYNVPLQDIPQITT